MNRTRGTRFQEEGNQDQRARISELETMRAIKKRAESMTAPGLDGITMRVIREMLKEGIRTLVALYNRCCDEEYFPEIWTRAALVLIPKEMPVDPANPRVRSLCLLDETGKILETILVERIWEWMR